MTTPAAWSRLSSRALGVAAALVLCVVVLFAHPPFASQPCNAADWSFGSSPRSGFLAGACSRYYCQIRALRATRAACDALETLAASAPGQAFNPRLYPAVLINGPEAYTQRKWAEQQARRRAGPQGLHAEVASAV